MGRGREMEGENPQTDFLLSAEGHTGLDTGLGVGLVGRGA